jgi:hypothetical protein
MALFIMETGPGWLNELGSCRARVAQCVKYIVVVGPGWLNEFGSCRARVTQ